MCFPVSFNVIRKWKFIHENQISSEAKKCSRLFFYNSIIHNKKNSYEGFPACIKMAKFYSWPCHRHVNETKNDTHMNFLWFKTKSKLGQCLTLNQIIIFYFIWHTSSLSEYQWLPKKKLINCEKTFPTNPFYGFAYFLLALNVICLLF